MSCPVSPALPPGGPSYPLLGAVGPGIPGAGQTLAAALPRSQHPAAVTMEAPRLPSRHANTSREMPRAAPPHSIDPGLIARDRAADRVPSATWASMRPPAPPGPRDPGHRFPCHAATHGLPAPAFGLSEPAGRRIRAAATVTSDNRDAATRRAVRLHGRMAQSCRAAGSRSRTCNRGWWTI